MQVSYCSSGELLSCYAVFIVHLMNYCHVVQMVNYCHVVHLQVGDVWASWSTVVLLVVDMVIPHPSLGHLT